METLIIKQDGCAAHNAQSNNFIDFLPVVIQKHYVRNDRERLNRTGITFYCLGRWVHRMKGCKVRRPLAYITINFLTAIIFASGCSVAPVLRVIINYRNDKLQGPPGVVARVEDISIPGPAGEMKLRLYTPWDGNQLPILIYLHGGGWVFGNLDNSDTLCRYLARNAGCLVVSVDYRLAPKHKFPAAVEDAYCATLWTSQNAERINGDAARIAIGGASSGGNLAAAVCLMAKERGDPPLIFQLLAFPATNIATLKTDSYRTYAKGYGLTKFHVQWFRKQYLAREEDGTNPYASPLLAGDLRNLPPALVLTGEYDVLRDEGEAYAIRLKDEGVPARYIRYAATGHMAYWTISADNAGEAVQQSVLALQKAFSP